MTTITDALDRLFTNASTVMTQLGDEFDSQGFLRKIIHDQQHAYIDLLNACAHLDQPFDQAHQKIGYRLSKIAPQYGYEPQPEKVPTINIFNNDSAAVVYRRSSESSNS
ncbi:hypothetical protein ACFLYO_08080 [Chloroflexota bacterium]